MIEISPLPRGVALFVEQRLANLEAACREFGVPFYDDAGVGDHLKRVLLSSDFAYESFLRTPALLGPELISLMGDSRHADARSGTLSALVDYTALHSELRRFRTREALRLIWRDVNGFDSIESTLSGASVLAETCIELALRQAERDVALRYGNIRDSLGQPQRLIVMGLGKLGGGELNFSSDVDLIFAFAEHGISDGERSLEAESYFARVSQYLVALLAERSADGYVYRVDLRLRPFGNAGRLVFSFAALEQYYQREGRDWERYAWIKARPVAGDKAAGSRLVELLRPFVFRRYLDYSAFSGMREMKALIDAEVARKDMAQHVKLGPGGIREIEFIVQLVQLIRGGREPLLRARGLLQALAASEQLGFIPAARAKRLVEAYRFMRRLENRLQMFADRQTHELPQDEEQQWRIALALTYPDWAQLSAELDVYRALVSDEFAAIMAPAQRARSSAGMDPAWPTLWQQLKIDGIDPGLLKAAGFEPTDELTTALEGLLGSAAVRNASVQITQQLDRVLPTLLAAAAASEAPSASLMRLLRLIQAVTRRSAYISLLDEQPAAIKRLTEVFTASAFLAERVTAHPLLLDELFDTERQATIPDRDMLEMEISRRLATLEEVDPEAEIEILQEVRLAALFRIGLAFLSGRIDAVAVAHKLAEVADAVLTAVLRIVERDHVFAHGRIKEDSIGLGVIGYGSLGGTELGFNSDLDLVFIYDSALAHCESKGARSLEGARYFARLAQRIVHLLTIPTRSGCLYEVDIRLRPDGVKGLLVTNMDAFVTYQRERAWMWEHQALVRARAVAGDSAVGQQFCLIRAELLGATRDPKELRKQITEMRARWRAERDRSNSAQLDLKQGPGALVDIEFLLQGLVLQYAANHSALLASGNSLDLIEIAKTACLLSPTEADALIAAHAALLHRALMCTLDARSRIVPRDIELERHINAVLVIARNHGFDFATTFPAP